MQEQAEAGRSTEAGKSAVLAHIVMTADSGRAGELVPGESGGCYACESHAAINLHLPRNQTPQDSRGDPLGMIPVTVTAFTCGLK